MTALAPAHGRRVILHVEDGKAQQGVLKIILESNGFRVLQADTCEEALQLCLDNPVSLVLADHMLRGSTGTELARQIKALKPAVPVVMHSGYPPAEMRNLDGYIHKGEPVRDLVAYLWQLVNRFWE